jgi:hypothetical protein
MITTEADLQAALLLGGDIVCDPTVTIALDATMVVGVPNTRLLGGTFTVATGPAFQVTASDVEIAGLSITGPGGTTLDATQKLIYVLGTKAAPLFRVDIHDCRLTGSVSDSVWMEWCVDSTVHDNVITSFLDSGVMVVSGDRVSVTGNAIADGRIATGAVEVYGIAFTDLTNLAADRSKHCIVANNSVRLIDWEGIDTHGGDGIVVTGNSVTACRRSIALVTGSASRITAPTGCVVTGNAIDAAGCRVTADIGIFLAGISGTPASATITGNRIAGYDGTSQTPISTSNWDRANTFVGGNSRPHVPWTTVTLAGGWTANTSFPPQYMVDGNTVTLRGGAIPPAGGISGHPGIGTLGNAAAWPATRDFYATTKGSSATAGIGVLNVDVDGSFRVEYGSTSDTFTYWLTGSYQAI